MIVQKPKLLVINSNYPSESNLYGDVFVHSRLKHYTQNFEIQVLGCNETLKQNESYVYEGISVINTCSKKEFKDYINSNYPDLIAIHFVAGWMVDVIKQFTIPVFIWVHGFEALGWYRRLFNFHLKDIYSLFRYILSNTRQMFFMHQLIQYSNKTGKVKFVFVSDWMRKITQIDTLSNVKNYEIIPNPIDETMFAYQAKKTEHRKKILLIRSFGSKKYANDIAIKAIEILSKEDFFKDINFSIYGEGKYFNKLTQKIQKFENVNLYNAFIEHKNIPMVHKSHGIFLCPTRQDAQGVSMCEAMSSGLVPITSDNTAIPEFVNKKCAFLTQSPFDIAQAIKRMYFDENLFIQMSKNASEHIKAISGNKFVIKKEISMLFEDLLYEDNNLMKDEDNDKRNNKGDNS